MGFNRERGLPHVPTVHVTRMRTSQRGRYHFMGCVRVRNCHLLCHSKVLRSAPFLQFSQATHLPTPLALSLFLFHLAFVLPHNAGSHCCPCIAFSSLSASSLNINTIRGAGLAQFYRLQLARLINLQRIAHSDYTVTLPPSISTRGLLVHCLLSQSHSHLTPSISTKGLLVHCLLFWCTLPPSVYEGATSALSTLLLHRILLEATGWMYLASCTHPTPHKAKPSLCLSLIWEWSS